MTKVETISCLRSPIDGYRGFRQSTPPQWQSALDPTAVHPAFSAPFASAVAVLRGVPLGSGGFPSLIAAIDALAHLEFARVADGRQGVVSHAWKEGMTTRMRLRH